MSYNTDLPPTIRRTNQTSGTNPDDWVLETASGTGIATYSRVGMSVDVWWEDLVTYIVNNIDPTQPLNAVEDLTLLMVTRDWTVEK